MGLLNYFLYPTGERMSNMLQISPGLKHSDTRKLNTTVTLIATDNEVCTLWLQLQKYQVANPNWMADISVFLT